MRSLVVFIQFIHIVLCYRTAFALIVHVKYTSDKPFKEALLLPVHIPRLVQDPQNILFTRNRFFGFRRGGVLLVNLTVQDATQTALKDTFLVSSQNINDPLDSTDTRFSLQSASSVDGSSSRLAGGRALRFLANVLSSHQLQSNRTRSLSTDAPLSSPYPNRNQEGLLDKNTFHQNVNNQLTEGQNLGAPSNVVPFFLSSLSKKNAQKPYSLAWHDKMRTLTSRQLSDTKMFTSSAVSTNTLRKSNASSITSSNNRYFMIFSAAQWNNLNMTLMTSALYDSHWHTSSAHILSTYYKSALRVLIDTVHVQFSYKIPYDDSFLISFVNPTGAPTIIEGVIELINPGNEHLSKDDFLLRPTVFAAFLLNLTTAAVLTGFLMTTWKHSRTDLHVLMAFNFFIKSIYLLFDWRNLSLFLALGELDTFSWVLPRMVAKVKDIVSLMLILLLSLGWKVYRRELSVFELRFCAGFCILSFYLGVFEASVGGFQASREILHSLAYLAVIIAIKFNISILQSYLAEMDLGVQAARTYKKLQAYRYFRVVFFMFILKPSFLLFYKLSFLPDGDQGNWILVNLDNLIDWSLLVVLVYAFSPFDNFWLFKDLNIEGFGDNSDEQRPDNGDPEFTYNGLGNNMSILETFHGI